MNYLSINEEAIQGNSVIKEYLQIINKHQEYFKDKNIDDIIRIRLVFDRKAEGGTTSSEGQAEAFFDIRILPSQFSQEILDEMNALKMPPIAVDAF